MISISHKKGSWWIVVLLFLFFGLVTCEQNKISNIQRDWSHPTVLFSSPDSRKIGDFYTEVFDGTIYLVKMLFDTTDHFLEYSNIFLSEHQSGRESFFQKKINSQDYPAEQPVIFHDQFEKLYFFWNEREIDPEFEKWPSKRPQIGKFATNLVHKEKDLLSEDRGISKILYSGELSFLGLGSLGGPVRVTEDDKGQLHLAFQADSTFQTTSPSGKEITAGIPYVIYMRQEASSRWNMNNYLVQGTEVDIISLSKDQLIISYLGLPPLVERNQPTSNDVLVLISEDGGITWSEPNRVFLSGQKRGLMLRMSSAPDKVHLVWGRQTSSIPGSGEMWHAYSEDNGRSWTEGKAFLKLENSSKTVWHFVLSHDLISDQYGRIHWIGVIAKKDDKDVSNTLHYSMWSPSTKRWEKSYDLNFYDHPTQVQISIDKISQELYILWNEPLSGKLLYITKQLSEL